MEAFGQYLKEEREKKGLSIEEVHRRTKISLKVLISLEAGDAASLPPHVILRGFIKSYAEAVGIDPREAASHYRPATDPATKPLGTVQSVPDERRPRLALILAVAFLVIVGGLLLLRGRGSQTAAPTLVQSPAPALVPQVVNQAETAAPAPMPLVPGMPGAMPSAAPNAAPPAAPTAAPQAGLPQTQPYAQPYAQPATTPPPTQMPASQPVAARPAAAPSVERPALSKPALPPRRTTTQPLKAQPADSAPQPAEHPQNHAAAKAEATTHTLRAHALEATWLKVSRDHGPVREYLLKRGEQTSWKAAEHFKLTVGNAGGLKLFLDGKPVGTLGERGRVVTLALPLSTEPSGR